MRTSDAGYPPQCVAIDRPSTNRTRWLYTAFLLLGLAGLPMQAWPLDGMDALADKIVRTLQTAGTSAPREVLLSPTDCYDATTRTSLPLAVHLREQLEEPLQRAGYRLGEPRPALTDVWVLQCQWRRKDERLSVSFVATRWAAGKRERVSVISAWLPATAAMDDLLRPDPASYGRTLVHRLALNEHLVQPRRVYLRPVQVSNVVGGRPANDFFNDWLRDAVVQSNLLIPLHAAESLARLDKPTLRTRGIRPKAKQGMSLTGDLLAAQGELSGKVARDERNESQSVRIESLLHDEHGQALAQAAVDIPVHVLPTAVAADLADSNAQTLEADAATSHQGLEVELSTNRGEGKASYRIGEQIAFLVRVNRDAFVYLFDIDSEGRATLLYPAFQVAAKPLPAGQPLLLPDDGMPYELEVTEPAGKDLVWAVASTEPLDLPPELDADWAEADTLMERVRAMGKADAAFAEAQLVLHTSP